MGISALGLVSISLKELRNLSNSGDSKWISVTPGGTFLYLWGLTTVTWWPRLASSSPASMTPILTLLGTPPHHHHKVIPILHLLGAHGEPDQVVGGLGEGGEQ